MYLIWNDDEMMKTKKIEDNKNCNRLVTSNGNC